MYDDRCLVDLINKRFDDVNAQLSNLKSDMLRESQSLKEKHDKHEEQDTERFGAINTKLQPIDRMRWTIAGAASVAFVLLEAASKVIDHYINK